MSNYSKYKDRTPEETVELIKSILNDIGLSPVLKWNDDAYDGAKSCRVSLYPTKLGTNGKGTDVQVSVSTGASKNSVLTRDNKSGKTIRQNVPAHIALGHEIIHGYRSMLGKANADIDEEENTTTGVAEYDYEFTENKLRKEHNLNKRLTY